MPGPLVSIIIPTLNEAVNLPVLIPRIRGAIFGRSCEIIVVDDQSDDGTPQICNELARRYPVELIVRRPEDGLSGAVLEGMRAARGKYLVVMDADLQHPPEKIPELLEPLENGEADFVLGSRYVEGGTVQRNWSPLRRLNSRVATALARPFAGAIHDPMSGFFALARQRFEQAQHLTPLGYKIALELICKCGIEPVRIREVPIHFGTRRGGHSKLNIKQQFKYLEHLSRLYDYCFPRLSPVIKFLIVTLCAWLLGFAVYVTALAKTAAQGLVAPPPAVAVAYGAAIIATAVFHLRYTRTQRPFLVRPHPWRDFAIISLCEWAAACGVAVFASLRVLGLTAGELFMMSFGTATMVRYVLRKELLQDVRGLRTELRREGKPMARVRRAA